MENDIRITGGHRIAKSYKIYNSYWANGFGYWIKPGNTWAAWFVQYSDCPGRAMGEATQRENPNRDDVR